MKPFVADPDFTLYVGDVRDVLRELPAGSVHTCVTSPPYWGLRDYGTGAWEGGDPDCDHEAVLDAAATAIVGTDGFSATNNAGRAAARVRAGREGCKCGATRVDQQIGLEPTPEQFVSTLVDVFREVRRVLRDDGTLWLNLGDSFNSRAGGPQGETGERADRTYTAHQRKFRPGAGRADGVVDERGQRNRDGVSAPGLKPKDLVGIPWRVAFALQADGWYLRSDIIWSKPNPMPESVTDRPTKAHEYVFLLSKSPRYFFDQEAVREPRDLAQIAWRERYSETIGRWAERREEGISPGGSRNSGLASQANNPGRNLRSVWEIATQPYPEAHFATFPEALPDRCIRAGSSERGCCPECGAPWERLTQSQRVDTDGTVVTGAFATDAGKSASAGPRPTKHTETLGWRPSCECGGIDLTIIETPTGESAGHDPTLETGRKGLNRPRGDGEGRRPITRYEQEQYALALRASPARPQLEQEAGEAFAHYIHTDRSGARPVPPDLLEDWISRGLLERVEIPTAAVAAPVPCTVLDPFMGSATTALVARRLGRRSIGIELNEEYAALAARRLQQQSLFAGEAL